MISMLKMCMARLKGTRLGVKCWGVRPPVPKKCPTMWQVIFAPGSSGKRVSPHNRFWYCAACTPHQQVSLGRCSFLAHHYRLVCTREM